MPRARSKGNTNSTPVKTEEPPEAAKTKSEEQVDFDGDIEEEVEYEEVEEEVEEEEEEEVEEEVEEEEEEDDEEEEDEEEDEQGGQDEEMENAEIEQDIKKIHDELLALPPYGSEVYLGGIPVDASEDDLKEFCESIGEVTEVRMMKGKDSGERRGYAFVTFRTPDLASTAIKELNNRELKGRNIKCSTSQQKYKLFIGNLPKNWTLDDLEKAVKRVGPGVNSVELLKDPKNSRQNRGFAFVEYYNHACAEYSRKKMSNPKFKLDDKAPTVSWADQKSGESSASSQVKAVYVKNLPKDVTNEQLEKIFKHHGKITKVVLPPAKPGHERSRFGFVHFEHRSSAMKAIQDTETYELHGQKLECSLAKPQADQKSSKGSSNSQKAALLPNHPPGVGYGLIGGAHGVLGAGYGAAAYPQPLMYGGGPATSGMAMMPMLLPDGRIAYVLQQPGIQPQTLSPSPQQQRGGGGRSGGGSSSSGGHRRGGKDNRSGGNDNRGRGRSRYNPY